MKELKKLSKKKNKPQFSYGLSGVAAVLSHQLKSPLSAIKNYVDVLLVGDLGKLNPDQESYLNDILENNERMIDLVKDILDVSLIDARRLKLKPKPTDMESIIKEIIEKFSFLADARNCTVRFKKIGKVPTIMVDPLKMREVVSNIIFNAIEYNIGKANVEVTIQKKLNKFLFCCQDDGIGMTNLEKKKIFKKFYRGDEAASISVSGSGLGLFIARTIIKESKGKIWFKSKHGQGSIFCFSLPIK